MKMRTKAELRAREDALCEDLWYARHMIAALPDDTPADIVEGAEREAARIAANRDFAYLSAIIHDGYAIGRLHGELATVRWALGWASEDGLLDT